MYACVCRITANRAAFSGAHAVPAAAAAGGWRPAAQQLLALLGMATQLLDERETVTLSADRLVLRLERSLLGTARRIVPLATADIVSVDAEAYQSELMRRPKHRIVVRLASGAKIPLLSAYSAEDPADVVARLRDALNLPTDGGDSGDSDDDGDDQREPVRDAKVRAASRSTTARRRR